MTLTAHRPIAAGYQPIPGYVLLAKLGEGGFGEVWSCDAPGGVKKAIKFVFGSTQQRRGQREAKSLDRIKGVKHPFLLSLERYEVVDDRLTIVTELADGSVEDLYDQARAGGEVGLPPEKLLDYLREAADGLDYLQRDFKLQHLDIKPGNLLLVGGHIKVADFGLVKDLREGTQSVVGGLTPVYAPPEVFDGRPSLHSDQYSLAVMYQEMLTGIRPFSGKTIAQLATQHIHSAPNLRPLPPHQRPILARALEKDPGRRFESCSEFVAALCQPVGTSAIATAPQPIGPQRLPPPPVCSLEPLADVPRGDGPAIERTVVVAVGGLGALCLKELHRRVEQLPAADDDDAAADADADRLWTVHIDTDRETLATVAGSGDAGAGQKHWPVATPLGSPQDYRRGGSAKFQTLSRRWIYNIPRDGRTGGMRPLGRLAMLDHAEAIDTAIAAAYQSAAGDQKPVRVFLIGSLAGGTASGMLLDLAPRMRTLIDDAGGHDVEIVPLLSIGSLRSHPKHLLGLPNAIAATTELQHYLGAGGSYPGDRGVGWDPVPAARNPLRVAYVLSDGEVGGEKVNAIATAVDYVWTSAGGAGAWLELARRQDSQTSRGVGPSVRSVGVSRLVAAVETEDLTLAIAAARLRLVRWLGRPVRGPEHDGPAQMLRRAAGSDVAADDLADRWAGPMGGWSTLLAQFSGELQPPQDESETWVDPNRSFARLAGEFLRRRGLGEVTGRWLRRTAGELKQSVAQLGGDARWSLADLQSIAALAAEDSAAENFTAEDSAGRDADDAAEPTGDASHCLLEAEDWPAERLDAAAQRALRLAMRTAALTANRRIDDDLRNVQTRIRSRARIVAEAIREVMRIDGGDSADCSGGRPGAVDVNPWDDLPDDLAERFESIQRQLNLELGQTVMDLQSDSADARSIAGQVVSVAIELTRDAMANRQASGRPGRDDQISTGTTSAEPPLDSHATAALPADVQRNHFRLFETPGEGLAALPPTLLRCGGSTRRLVLGANEQQVQRVGQSLRGCPAADSVPPDLPLSFFHAATLRPTLIQEASGIGTAPLLQLLAGGCGSDPAAAVKRLHSRTDVAWGR